MSRKSTKFTVFICNLVISVLCIVAILAYFFLPFWKVDLSLKIEASALTELLQSSQGESGEENEEENEETENALSDIDFAEVIGDEGVHISLTITLQTKDVLSSLNGEANEVVDTLLKENIDNVVDQLNEPLNKLMHSAMKTVANVTISELLKDRIKDSYAGEKTMDEVEDLMHDAGLSDEYIADKTEELFNALYADDASIDTVSNKAIEIIEDAFGKMEEVDNSTTFHLTENDKETVREEIEDVLSNIASENGEIDMDSLIADLILQMLGEDSENSEEGNANLAPLALSISGGNTTNESDTSDTSATTQLKETLRTTLMDLIDTKTAEMIVQVFKIVSYVILFTFFTWAWLIIKIILKLGAKNNAIKLKLPIWLGSIPFWVLYLLPTVGIALLKNPPDFLADMITPEITATFASFDITFFTCAWVPFIVGVVLCLFSIFFYSRQRKILKKYKKGILTDEKPVFNGVGVEMEEETLD